MNLGIYAGAGEVFTSNHNASSMQFGAGFGQYEPHKWYGVLFEGGYAGPWSDVGAGSAVFSANYVKAWLVHPSRPMVPFATVGYTRLFGGTGNALNFGGGVDMVRSESRAIRLEVRDYEFFSSPQQHNVAVRVGWILYLPD